MNVLKRLSLPVLLLAGAIPFSVLLIDAAEEKKKMKSIYEYPLKNIEGKDVSLADYRNKVLLIVNVASACGATPQYGSLVALQKKYAEKGFVVLGFPANNFGGQEPGTNEEIKGFCTREYDVNFPMFAKLSVGGDNPDPLFEHLTKANNADFTGPIQWNFEKFLVGKDGLLLRRFRTGTEPDDGEVIEAIEEAVEAEPAGAGAGCEDC